MRAPDRIPSALGYALLTYMTLVIAAITLIPFNLSGLNSPPLAA
jgi:hypothetical protein